MPVVLGIGAIIGLISLAVGGVVGGIAGAIEGDAARKQDKKEKRKEKKKQDLDRDQTTKTVELEVGDVEFNEDTGEYEVVDPTTGQLWKDKKLAKKGVEQERAAAITQTFIEQKSEEVAAGRAIHAGKANRELSVGATEATLSSSGVRRQGSGANILEQLGTEYNVALDQVEEDLTRRQGVFDIARGRIDESADFQLESIKSQYDSAVEEVLLSGSHATQDINFEAGWTKKDLDWLNSSAAFWAYEGAGILTGFASGLQLGAEVGELVGGFF